MDFCKADLSDALIDELFLRSEAVYPSSSSAAYTQVKLLVIGNLLFSASKLVDYTQNESSEKLSQILTNLMKIKEDLLTELDIALNGNLPAVMWGALRRVTPHYVEFPSDYNIPFDLNDLSRFESATAWLP